jgi:hypothetical protein
MKRLTRAQFASLKLLITALIAADLFAIWVWATRPPRIYSDWLGLTAFRADTPFRRLVAWAAWDDGPRTPAGFLMLFDPIELVFSGVLLLALVLMTLFLLSPRETDGTIWRRMSAKAGTLRFRMRTALVLLAIIGVYLSVEVHAWRTWRLRSDFKRQASQASLGVNSSLSTLRSIREERRAYDPGLERKDESARRVVIRSRNAAARGIAVEDLKRQEVDLLLAKLVAFTELKLKNERAAANPLDSVAPSRPLPGTEKEAADWLNVHDFGRALAVYDELARTYPQLVEARSRSAWIRATCPDAKYRNGKLAVESAQRACELTDWHDPAELEVLAAACAEAGDFESAVKWKEKVLALTKEPGGVQSCQQRLALYQAGKTFRVAAQGAQ